MYSSFALCIWLYLWLYSFSAADWGTGQHSVFWVLKILLPVFAFYKESLMSGYTLLEFAKRDTSCEKKMVRLWWNVCVKWHQAMVLKLRKRNWNEILCKHFWSCFIWFDTKWKLHKIFKELCHSAIWPEENKTCSLVLQAPIKCGYFEVQHASILETIYNLCEGELCPSKMWLGTKRALKHC